MSSKAIKSLIPFQQIKSYYYYSINLQSLQQNPQANSLLSLNQVQDILSKARCTLPSTRLRGSSPPYQPPAPPLRKCEALDCRVTSSCL